jgi:hypothetical protein
LEVKMDKESPGIERRGRPLGLPDGVDHIEFMDRLRKQGLDPQSVDQTTAQEIALDMLYENRGRP